MYCSRNSFKKGAIQGTTIGVIKGDTRSFHKGSYGTTKRGGDYVDYCVLGVGPLSFRGGYVVLCWAWVGL